MVCHTIPITPSLRSLLANERGKHPIYVFTDRCAEDRHDGTKGARRTKASSIRIHAMAGGVRGFGR